MLAFRDFPAHVQLMLLTSRSHLRASEIEQIHDLAAEKSETSLDWNQFLAVTAHHRVSSLVFDSLEQTRPGNLPEAVHSELQHRARHNAFEALRSTNEVRRIANSFATAGIELSVLKGVPLSQSIFGNPNCRHVGDIDILTQPNRLPEQIALLSELGYEIVNPKSRLTPLRIASYVSFWKDFTFQSRAAGFELDLHWRLFNNRLHAANRIVTEGVYETITAFGVPMRVFSDPDQFLYIAAHGVLDAFTYLKSLADVAGYLRFLTPEQLDQALTRAQQLNLLTQISAAIHLCNDWMGTETTHPRLLPASEPLASRIRERTAAMLLQQDFKPLRNFASPADWLRLEIDLVPGLRSLTEIARRYVWRPRVWAAVDLPDQLFWCYPILGLLTLPRHHSADD